MIASPADGSRAKTRRDPRMMDTFHTSTRQGQRVALWGVGPDNEMVASKSVQTIIILDGLAATACLIDPLDRRSYTFEAGCADSRLIWGSVRRFRSMSERNYLPFLPNNWKRPSPTQKRPKNGPNKQQTAGHRSRRLAFDR